VSYASKLYQIGAKSNIQRANMLDIWWRMLCLDMLVDNELFELIVVDIYF